MKSVKFTTKQKYKAILEWQEYGFASNKAYIVVARHRCSERQLWRWKAMYNGTMDSLQSKSSANHTPNYKSHTVKEIEYIKQAIADNPNMGIVELYGVLRTQCGYSRSYGGMYNFIRRKGLNIEQLVDLHTKYTPQDYDTPIMLGIKWQMDIKFVPSTCYNVQVTNTKYYQYTMLDEATRERFIYPYDSYNAENTKDFVYRAIVYFGYKPKIIQTDNGREFKNKQVDIRLAMLSIQHQYIRPYTPRHNGKVERSHRNDNNRFYANLTFDSLEELRNKMQVYNIRSNNIPTRALFNRYGKRVYMTPLQKREELLQDLLDKSKVDIEKPKLLRISKRQDIVALLQVA